MNSMGQEQINLRFYSNGCKLSPVQILGSRDIQMPCSVTCLNVRLRRKLEYLDLELLCFLKCIYLCLFSRCSFYHGGFQQQTSDMWWLRFSKVLDKKVSGKLLFQTLLIFQDERQYYRKLYLHFSTVNIWTSEACSSWSTLEHYFFLCM